MSNSFPNVFKRFPIKSEVISATWAPVPSLANLFARDWFSLAAKTDPCADRGTSCLTCAGESLKPSLLRNSLIFKHF